MRPLPVPPHVAPIVEAGGAVATRKRLHARVNAAVSDHVLSGGEHFTALTTRELAAAAPWREHLIKLLQQQVLSSSDQDIHVRISTFNFVIYLLIIVKHCTKMWEDRLFYF